MNKTIEIKKAHIRNLLLSFLLGFSILFVLEHFGKFSYIAQTPYQPNDGKMRFESYVSNDAPILSIYYDTFFGNKVTTGGNGFDVYDLNYQGGDFQKYSVESYYYTQATIKDFKYGSLFSILIFCVFLFFNNFKIKLS